MKFLLPVGGITDSAFGILTSYKHKGVPSGIIAGLPWAADNCAFTGFDEGRFFGWIETMQPYRDTCLFVAVPDVVGDAAATIAMYRHYAPQMAGWPLAYVAQDGSERHPIPDCAAVFIGGSTGWKVSEDAVSVIRRAQRQGRLIHIGRVNWGKRYNHFRVMTGSEHWTCDGTRTRFEGVEKTLRTWKRYQDTTPLIQL